MKPVLDTSHSAQVYSAIFCKMLDLGKNHELALKAASAGIINLNQTLTNLIAEDDDEMVISVRRARLTDNQKQEISNLFDEGLTRSAIALRILKSDERAALQTITRTLKTFNKSYRQTT